jgi:hypothetical protein
MKCPCTASRLTVSICRLQKFKLMTANTVINSENESLETMGTDQVTLLFSSLSFYLCIDLACELCVKISIAKVAGQRLLLG